MSLDTWKQRHQAIVDTPADAKKQAQLVIIGDSIVAGWDRAHWDQSFAKYHALNFGIGGDKTQQLLWRFENGELDGLQPRVTVLLIGTNNIGSDGANLDDVARGVAKVIGALQTRLPSSKVLLLGVFPRGEKPSDPMRAEVAGLDQRLEKLGDGKRVVYLDIGAKFLEKDGSISKEIMYDFLHPTAKGYQILGDAILPTVERLARE